uniref:Uncharacterized protein n=1 Tax=Planktothricoides sp. SpSt-374 TaxID=2282167 RepID=A0A7C3ZUF5_9CYAN
MLRQLISLRDIDIFSLRVLCYGYNGVSSSLSDFGTPIGRRGDGEQGSRGAGEQGSRGDREVWGAGEIGRCGECRNRVSHRNPEEKPRTLAQKPGFF